MRVKRGILGVTLTIGLCGAALAESEVTPGTEAGPGVTIIQRGQETVQEYRVGNQLYMIKITPSKGAPYYLVDIDGDGTLETRRSDLDPEVVTPQWVLLRWR